MSSFSSPHQPTKTKKILFFREDEDDDKKRYRGRDREDDDASFLSVIISLSLSLRAANERERESALFSLLLLRRELEKSQDSHRVSPILQNVSSHVVSARVHHTNTHARTKSTREFDDDEEDMIASSSSSVCRPIIAVYPTKATQVHQFREKKQPSIGRQRHPSSSSSSLSLRARRRRNCATVVLASNDGNDEDVFSSSSSSSLAPSTPTSPHGEMLEYILSTEPSSFEGAVDSVLEKLSDEIDSSSKKAAKSDDKNNDGEEKKDSMSLTLYKRIEDIKRMDRRRAVEDAMYASIIHKVS